ncbi:MAG: DUF1802 family protein [Chthoniobacterales bacterium]
MNIGFKEWAIICDALGSGRQSIIIRKGGIAEGRDGFSFKEKEFALFPTWFHAQIQKTILPPATSLPPQEEGYCDIRYVAALEWSRVVTDHKRLHALRDFHVWDDSVLEERFAYAEAPGVHVALVRIYRLEPACRLQLERRHGGCRSWVQIPEISGNAMVSVLSDEEHLRRKKLLETLIPEQSF